MAGLNLKRVRALGTKVRAWANRLTAGQRTWSLVAIQLAALIGIFSIVNYLSFRHYAKADLTQNERFTLSPATLSTLRNLPSKVEVIVAFMRGSDVYDDMRALVEEYQRNGDKRLSVEFIDPARQPARALEVQSRHGVSLEDNAVIVARGRQVRVLPEAAFVFRDGTGRVTRFAGEIAITGSLIEVTEGEPRSIYVVTGYQGSDYLRDVFEEVRVMGSRQNAEVNYLDLAVDPSVPDDADLVVLAAPRYDPPESEMQALRAFWKSERGALWLTLDADRETPELERFLREVGVVVRDDRVVYAVQVPGQPLRKDFSVPVYVREGTPVSRGLGGLRFTLAGRSRSLEIFEGAEEASIQNIHLTPLLRADERFWGETDHRQERIERDRMEDHHAPLYLAAMVEKGAVNDPNLRVETNRMVVVSNPSLLTTTVGREKAASDFSAAALNWLLDRTEVSGIAPKEPTRYSVALSAGQMAWIDRLAIFLLPAVTFALAAFVGAMRRI